MSKDIQIIPGILSTSEEDYQEKIKKLSESDVLKAGWIQLDLMDEKFVQNKSITPDIIGKYPHGFKVEAQLMVEYPENWIDELIKLKVDRIVFPLEDNEGVKERIKHIKNHGIEVGLSINPETETSALEPFMSTIDVVLIMSVHPGFGGQEFIFESIAKVREIRDNFPETIIEVDGGISEDIALDLVNAGANILVVGANRLLKGDLDENLEKFWEKLKA